MSIYFSLLLVYVTHISSSNAFMNHRSNTAFRVPVVQVAKDYIVPRTFSSFPSPDNPNRDDTSKHKKVDTISPQQMQHIQEQIKYMDEEVVGVQVKSEEKPKLRRPNNPTHNSTLSSLSYLASLNTTDTYTVPEVSTITFSSVSSDEATPYSSFYNEVITNQMPNDRKTLHIQGGALKTCRMHESVDRLTLSLSTNGNQLNSDIFLWDGPNECPQKISVYLENGQLHPFYATIENADTASVIAVRNTGQITFPLIADHLFQSNDIESTNTTLNNPAYDLSLTHKNSFVQHGGTFTAKLTDFDEWVEVAILNDGRPINARIELMNGPYDVREIIEVSLQDGKKYPFYTVMQIHGDCSLRIMNTASADFPFRVTVVSHSASRMRSHQQI
jgi:hypothetical protein